MNIREEDLVNNPTPRISVCLCVDTSSSMQGAPIHELNEGIKMFYDAVMQDEIALYSAEISVVTFGNGVECIQDFGSLERVKSVPQLMAHGYTPMGEAVNLALDLFEQRKKEYRAKGVDYYQPWLVLMTDGAPNGDANELDRSVNRTVSLVDGKKLTVFPIGIGAEADMAVLQRFSPTRVPLKLQGLKFKEFFKWLSQSVSRTSQSTPGEKVPLDVEGIGGWGEL
ncbi:vWA domain-containing protein [Caryophanon latum]|nr:VWA domain-containing protein [Caryophanon latum]